MVEITALDCSPFDLKNGDEEVLKTLSKKFLDSNPTALESDEMVVRLRTTFEKSQEPNKPESQTRWWAGRYIGVANLKVGKKDYEITIRPRFGEKFLLNILEEYDCFKFAEHQGESDFNIDWFSNLLNILRRKLWIEKCAYANRYGLPYKNIKKIHQSSALKGSIDIHRTIIPWKSKKEITTVTYNKELDACICHIVYEAHRILSKNIIHNKGKRKNLTEKASSIMGISIPPIIQDTINLLENEYKGKPFTFTENDYMRIRYKNIYAAWKPLVDFSWNVIRERQISMRNADEPSDCVFVDIAEIWEAFLRRKLGEGLYDEGWRVWSVEECEQKVYKSGFFGRKIIPDIVLQRNVDGKEQFLIFDAKYKRMTGNKLDVDRTDFFQIHTYIHYFQHTYPDGEVLLGGLLYPLTKNSNQEEVNIDEVTGAHALFGREDGLFNTKFIVDGIVCPESNEEFDKDSIDSNIEGLIERIKDNIQ